MANITASASGDKQITRHPMEKEHGQKDDADAKCRDKGGYGDLRGAFENRLAQLVPVFKKRSIFSIVTVASSTRMPTASANPPSVIVLMVSPIRLRTITEVRIESGIETAMMRVERQLPRKSRIIRPVSAAAITASRITPRNCRAHKYALIAQRRDLEIGRNSLRHAREQVAYTLHHTQGRRIAGLENGDQHPPVAVLADNVGLKCSNRC